MRVEYTYEIHESGGRLGNIRSDYTIEETRTLFCEDPACEATHDDPSAKWDQRSYRTLCLAYNRDSAERIVAAMPKVMRS